MADRSIPLEQFQIQSPCTADWDAMHGDDAKRFCDKCNKHVHDLSQYDRAEADALLAAPVAGHACVRMARDGEGRVITRDYWKIAAGAALAATVGLNGCSRTQGEMRPAAGSPPPPPAHAPMGEACASGEGRVLMGDVAAPTPKPPMGTPVPMPPPAPQAPAP